MINYVFIRMQEKNQLLVLNDLNLSDSYQWVQKYANLSSFKWTARNDENLQNSIFAEDSVSLFGLARVCDCP